MNSSKTNYRIEYSNAKSTHRHRINRIHAQPTPESKPELQHTHTKQFLFASFSNTRLYIDVSCVVLADRFSNPNLTQWPPRHDHASALHGSVATRMGHFMCFSHIFLLFFMRWNVTAGPKDGRRLWFKFELETVPLTVDVFKGVWNFSM